MVHNKFMVSSLRDVCAQMGLLTTGNKAEIIKRLKEADPTDACVGTVTLLQTSDKNSERPGDHETDRNSILAITNSHEKELTRRELEFFRNASPNTVQPLTPHIDLNTMKDMLGDFSGSEMDFRIWKDQFIMLKSTYRLDDEQGRLLLDSKLKGKALRWFHSNKRYIAMPVNDLLIEIGTMFDRREDRLTLRKKFETRTWKASESFTDYFHEKIILSNSVTVEEELVDYLIEGIPDMSLRN